MRIKTLTYLLLYTYESDQPPPIAFNCILQRNCQMMDMTIVLGKGLIRSSKIQTTNKINE
jgi:hypothetical protein